MLLMIVTLRLWKIRAGRLAKSLSWSLKPAERAESYNTHNLSQVSSRLPLRAAEFPFSHLNFLFTFELLLSCGKPKIFPVHLSLTVYPIHFYRGVRMGDKNLCGKRKANALGPACPHWILSLYPQKKKKSNHLPSPQFFMGADIFSDENHIPKFLIFGPAYLFTYLLFIYLHTHLFNFICVWMSYCHAVEDFCFSRMSSLRFKTSSTRYDCVCGFQVTGGRNNGVGEWSIVGDSFISNNRR